MHVFLQTAVKEHVLDKVEGGEYSFPSGRSEDDFDHWLLKKMYNWDKNFGATGEKIQTTIRGWQKEELHE